MSSRHSKTSRWKSISSRVTIWYSIFFILLSVLLLGGVYLVSDYYITQSARSQLEAAVIDSVGDYAEGDFEANDDGVYLSRYTDAGQLVEGAVPIPLNEPLTHERLGETVVNDVRYLYYDYQDSGSGFWFRGILSARQNDQITHNLFGIILLALPIAVILVLGGGYVIIRRALAPIKTMSETARRIESSLDLSQRIALAEGDSELHQLAQSFNSMLDKVEDSYERERQFTGDVSHELRTPIAVIQSEAEYAQAASGLPQDLRESLTVIQRQTRQMTRLVTSLLDMARIDHQEGIDSQPVQLSQLLAEAAENYALIAEAEGKELSLDLANQLTVQGDSQLLKRLADNLLANAVKFSQQKVWLKAWETDGQVCLSISNDGPAIPPDQQDKIWQRLYQVDSSRHSSGLGLGLSFVKKIAELHGASVSVESREDLTDFRVCFPAADSST